MEDDSTIRPPPPGNSLSEEAAEAVFEFCYLGQDDDHRLSQFERLTMLGGKELERAVDWLKRSGTKALPFGEIGGLAVADLERARDFYQDCISFFAPPEKMPTVREIPVHRLPDGEILDIEFASGYIPRAIAGDSRFMPGSLNDTVVTRLWRHQHIEHAGARPLLLAIHGWAMGDQRVNSVALLPGFFYLRGFDVALIELPFHGRRKVDGVLFPGANPFLNAEGIGQAIHDIRILREHLGPKIFSTLGISFGGYIAALLASLDVHEGVVVVSPVVDLAEAAWDILSRRPNFESLKASGVSRELLGAASAIHSPLARPSKLSADQMLIVAGLSDEVLGPRHAKLLSDHWRRAKIVRVMGGHVGELAEGKTALQTIEVFLGEIISQR